MNTSASQVISICTQSTVQSIHAKICLGITVGLVRTFQHTSLSQVVTIVKLRNPRTDPHTTRIQRIAITSRTSLITSPVISITIKPFLTITNSHAQPRQRIRKEPRDRTRTHTSLIPIINVLPIKVRILGTHVNTQVCTRISVLPVLKRTRTLTHSGVIIPEEPLRTSPQTSIIQLKSISMVSARQLASQSSVIRKISLRTPLHTLLPQHIKIKNYTRILSTRSHTHTQQSVPKKTRRTSQPTLVCYRITKCTSWTKRHTTASVVVTIHTRILGTTLHTFMSRRVTVVPVNRRIPRTNVLAKTGQRITPAGTSHHT